MTFGQERSGGSPHLSTFSHFIRRERESSRKKMMMMVMRIRWIGWRIWIKLNERLREIMLEERKMREKEERERERERYGGMRKNGRDPSLNLVQWAPGHRDLAA